MRGLILAAAAAAAFAGSGAGIEPTRDRSAILPARQTGKTLHKVPSRKDRKRYRRSKSQGKTHYGFRGGSTKLGRRLFRKHQMGRYGAF